MSELTGLDELDLVRQLAVDLAVPVARAEAVRRDDVEHQGTRLSALRWGAGRPSHVLLHGGAQNAHTWDRMMLHGQLDAVAIDLPGHGRSSWMEARTYLARELAPIVAYGIDHWAPDADAVVGMSLGGLTAIRLCSIRPDLVKRLVILDVTPGSTPDRSADIREFVTATDFRSFEALFDHAASFLPNADERSLRRSLLHNAHQLDDGSWGWRHDRRDPPGEGRMDRVFADLASYWDDVAALTCPVLLVTGGRSPIVTTADIERFTALAPQTEVVEIADAGHMVQSDAPIVLARLIEGFTADRRPHRR